jgi:signal transduction histidine kinase
MNNINILIVDDKKSNISALKALLSSESDITIFDALSAKEALILVIKNEIDLILCDIQMPYIDGFEFSKLLQKNSKTKNIPFIFVTAAFDNELYENKSYQLGAIDYIAKPIDELVLQSKLFKYVELFKARKEVEKQNAYIKSILESYEEANIVIDSSFKLLDYNERVLELFPKIELEINFLRYLENCGSFELLIKSLVDIKIDNPLIIEYEEKSYKITIKRIQNDFIIIFYNITEIQNKNKLLLLQSKQLAMGEILSIISHQWKQPLTTIGSILSKIKIKNELNKLTLDDVMGDMNNIDKVIKHLAKTINLFQNYFKEKDGSKIKLNELFDSINSIIFPILKNNNIEHKLDYEDNYKLDDRLDHVLLNIYQNANDALNNNESIKEKKICTKIYNTENQTIIEISDNAGGISKEIKEKIFDPYFSTKSKNGTGLGLYMSKNIVEKYIGGQLKVTNTEVGACFHIIIPNS